jgi:hypothetical protein
MKNGFEVNLQSRFFYDRKIVILRSVEKCNIHIIVLFDTILISRIAC